MAKNKPGFLSSLTGAIDDVVNEIKADVQSMTPPGQGKVDPRKEKERAEYQARISDIVNQSTSGLAESYIDTDLPPMEFEEEHPNQPVSSKPKPVTTLPTGNLWHALKNPSVTTRLRADACFHALTVGDIKQYYEAVANEKIAPFTLGILSLNLPALTQDEIEDDNGGDPDLLVLAMLKTIETETRIYGAVGAGPRSLWQDLELMDDHLSNMLNNNPKLIALGPVGLDEPFAPYTLAQQQQQLKRQLEIALDFELPVFISNRKSHAALAQTLEEKGALPPLVYLDSITEQADADLIKRFDMFAMLRPEITAPTYPMAQAYRDLPQSKLLLGCGSSLVAPNGFSGHFNEPKYLTNTRDAAARILAMTPDALITLTNNNLTQLFPQI